MFGSSKTETNAPSKATVLITPAEASALAAGQSHLGRLSANEHAIRTVADDIERHSVDIAALREQRGGAVDPAPLNRQISRAQSELEVLEDRAAFLKRERAELRADVAGGYNAVMNARSAAIQRVSAAFGAELQACVEKHLAPLLAKGLALGSIGDALSAAAVNGIQVPNPTNMNIPLVQSGRLYSAKENGDLNAECAAIIEALAPLRDVDQRLSRLNAEIKAEIHLVKQAETTRAFASLPQPMQGGMQPPPDLEREKGLRLFPRTEIRGAVMYPNDPSRRTVTAGHMYNPDAQRFEDMEKQEIGT